MSGRGRAIVVGAGVGGLAAACDLANAGLEVTVLERAEVPGGKMRTLRAGAFDVDAGPTVFTMHWVFDGLFADAGESFEDAVTLESAEVLARHAWTAGGRLDLFADPQASIAAIDDFAGPREAAAYRRFVERSAEVYATLERPFIRTERPRSTLELVSRVGITGVPSLARTQPMMSLWSTLGEHFRDPRLRQLFARYSTYVGSSPLKAPATLMLIAHVEQSGVWLVKGGMRELARQMQFLGERRGAQFRFGAHVEEILVSGGHVRGVRLAGGETLSGDAVVFNGDSAALAGGLLGKDVVRATVPTARTQRSLSAVTWCLAAKPEGFPLQHHNVFFSDDYPKEFRQIFESRTVTEAPTVYLCAQGRSAKIHGPQPQGDEPMLLLINAPADGDRGWPIAGSPSVDELQARTIGMLEACGLSLPQNSFSAGQRTTPSDFADRFPGNGGALYGRANHGPFAIFERPTARLDVPGLYLAGGSAHPGAGVPMATLSGRMAAARLLSDRQGKRRGGTAITFAKGPAADGKRTGQRGR